MKSIVRNYIYTCLFISLLACESATSYEEVMAFNRETIKDAKKLEDATFLVDAKSFSMLQTILLKLAQEKGYSSVTVNLGKDNVGLFQALESDIRALAEKEDVRVPDKMSLSHLQQYEELSKTERAKFDQRFVFALKSINTQEAKLFEEKATTANDPDVRAFAARKLDQFRSQELTLQKIEAQLIPAASR